MSFDLSIGRSVFLGEDHDTSDDIVQLGGSLLIGCFRRVSMLVIADRGMEEGRQLLM